MDGWSQGRIGLGFRASRDVPLISTPLLLTVLLSFFFVRPELDALGGVTHELTRASQTLASRGNKQTPVYQHRLAKGGRVVWCVESRDRITAPSGPSRRLASTAVNRVRARCASQ